MKVAIYTLGCKVNQYETQAMGQELRRRGHEVVDFAEEADAYVINSCSVTAVSDQKSRQVLHRVRRNHPEAVAALAGCNLMIKIPATKFIKEPASSVIIRFHHAAFWKERGFSVSVSSPSIAQ